MTRSESVRIEGAVALSAQYDAGAGLGAVVAPPHPMMGGRMDNPVVVELASGLAEGGASVLRFDWRGVGGSEGVASASASDADEDYGAALDELARRGVTGLIAAGYSFGAAAALRAAGGRGDVERVVLVALPAAMGSVELLAAVSAPVTLIAGDADSFCPLPVAEGWARECPGVTLHVIEGCDHFFAGPPLDRIAPLAARAIGAG